MVWFQVDDGLSDHPKADAAGNAALGLWVRLGAYCAKHLTDGFILDGVPSRYGTRAELGALVKAGLLVKVNGGYQMHQYLQRNRSKQLVEDEREAARLRMANVRANKGRTFGGSSAVRSASLAVVPNGTTTRPPGGGGRRGKCKTHSQELPCLGCASDSKVGDPA